MESPYVTFTIPYSSPVFKENSTQPLQDILWQHALHAVPGCAYVRRSAVQPHAAHGCGLGRKPCAASPATIPARMSPLPPRASPALPVVLRYSLPSGVATRVRWPFSTVTAPVFRANPRATSAGICSTCATEMPARRAISPGCGVTTSRPARGASASTAVPMAESPPASSTKVPFAAASSARISSAVASSAVRPHPARHTVYCPAAAKSSSRLWAHR